jgi:RNA polymerase sigma-70 factor (ECF subfamily)
MGSFEQFDEFYQAAFARLVGQLFLVTGDLQAAEDVVQEAFVRALARWTRLRTFDVPELWVRRVALNLAISERRRVRRRLAVAAWLPLPRAVPPMSENALALAEALKRLPVTHRQVVLLHYALGLPVDQVAEQLRLPAATVRGRLARARAGLRDQLSPALEEPEEEVRPRHG